MLVKILGTIDVLAGAILMFGAWANLSKIVFLITTSQRISMISVSVTSKSSRIKGVPTAGKNLFVIFEF